MSEFQASRAHAPLPDAEEDAIRLPGAGSATEAGSWDDRDGVNEPGEDNTLDRHDDPKFIRWMDRKMGPVRDHPVAGPAWKLVVIVIGLTLVAGGLIMVFVPGPGWATVLLGVAVLATEFVWARRVLRFGNHHVGRWTRWVNRQPAWLRYVIGFIAILGIVSIILSLLYFVGKIDVPAKLGLPGFSWAMERLGLRPR